MAKKVLTPEELSLVAHLELKKAKVPLKSCLKLSLKNMWKKKIRYLVMFIICALSLTFFSVTIELNGEKLRQNVFTMIENGYRYTDIYEHVELTKDEIKENEYNKYAYTALSGNSLVKIKDSVNNITIHEYKPVSIYYNELNIENANYFYTGYINSIIRYDESNNYELVAGRLPKEDTKEILITDYLVAAFEYFNMYPSCNNIYDYLNIRLNLVHHEDYVVVGILKTNYTQWTHFATVETIEVDNKENYSFTNDFIFMNSVILTGKYFDIEKIGKSSAMGFNNSNTGASNSTARWTFSIKDPSNPSKTKSYGYLVEDGTQTKTSYAVSSTNLDLIKKNEWDNSTFGRYPQNENEIVISYRLISQLFGYNWTYTGGEYRSWDEYRNHRDWWAQINGTQITLTLTGYANNPQNYEKTYKT